MNAFKYLRSQHLQASLILEGGFYKETYRLLWDASVQKNGEAKSAASIYSYLDFRKRYQQVSPNEKVMNFMVTSTKGNNLTVQFTRWKAGYPKI